MENLLRELECHPQKTLKVGDGFGTREKDFVGGCTFIGRRLPQTLFLFLLHGRFLGKCLENFVSSSMSPAEKTKRNAIFIGRFQSYKYTGQGTLFSNEDFAKRWSRWC